MKRNHAFMYNQGENALLELFGEDVWFYILIEQYLLKIIIDYSRSTIHS